jgi:hypothetical protein
VEVSNILAVIDAEIAKLQQARALLSGSAAPKAGRGRPKGSKNLSSLAVVPKAAKVANAKAGRSKRQLSPEGRKAIADAMKRRWAERRQKLAS